MDGLGSHWEERGTALFIAIESQDYVHAFLNG